ncbi:MAG: FAD-dependent oxidoreductase, partial [Promethearchaeota archaeon]
MKVGIIGAGSAGLLAANELGKHLDSRVDIKVFDAGPNIEERSCPQKNEYECAQCDPCRIMSGVGGAGAWSSGILNLNKNIGGDLEQLCSRATLDVNEIINQIDEFFLANGAPNNIFDPYHNGNDLNQLKRKCAANDIRFIPIRQRLLGSKNTPKVIKSIVQHLESHFNINIIPDTKIIKFSKKRNLIFENGKQEQFDYLLIAPGRWGMLWLANQCENLGINTFYEPLDIGVRVEVSSIIMEDICENIQRDPKFHI